MMNFSLALVPNDQP